MSKSYVKWKEMQMYLLQNPTHTAGIVTPAGTFAITLKPRVPASYDVDTVELTYAKDWPERSFVEPAQ